MTIEIMIKKTFRPEVKAVDTEDGSIDMLIPMSTASIDRDGESIDPLGWKKSLPAFRKRPVLLSSHDYGDLRKQIGEFKSIKITEDGLFAKPKYYINEGNEEADWAFKLASKGMAAYSVGFIPKAWTDGDGEKEPKRTYTEQELLEISHVVVPSNRDAIQGLRGKSADPIVNEVIDDVLKMDTIVPDLVTKPEETDEYIRIPVDRGDHEGHRIRTIEISAKEGISAIYCGTDKVIMTYLFAKDHDWTMEKAKAWVKEHEGKSINELIEHKTSQKEIGDELDYIRSLIIECGLDDINKLMAWALVKDIMRVPGSDIPADIVVQVIRDSGFNLVAKPEPKQVDEKTQIMDVFKRILEHKLN